MEILFNCIFCRYEYWSKSGKNWTDWFIIDDSCKTEDEAKNVIKKYKDNIKSIDKFTKLKHEYKYELVDKTLLDVPKMVRPKGRPKKIDKEYLDNIVKELKKKNEVIIDDNIKSYLYNDESAKEYIRNKFDKNVNIIYWYNFSDQDKKLYILKK